MKIMDYRKNDYRRKDAINAQKKILKKKIEKVLLWELVICFSYLFIYFLFCLISIICPKKNFITWRFITDWRHNEIYM